MPQNPHNRHSPKLVPKSVRWHKHVAARFVRMKANCANLRTTENLRTRFSHRLWKEWNHSDRKDTEKATKQKLRFTSVLSVSPW